MLNTEMNTMENTPITLELPLSCEPMLMCELGGKCYEVIPDWCPFGGVSAADGKPAPEHPIEVHNFSADAADPTTEFSIDFNA